jgi:two-component system sensor histidine kinase KdpD
VNASTAGFIYLLTVLTVATAWGLAEAVLTSVVATLCFNFFFLPPVGTLTVADPENWVALLTFLITAITASQLSSRAKDRAQEALAHQRETERLYTLSRSILLIDAQNVPERLASQIAQTLEVPKSCSTIAFLISFTGRDRTTSPEWRRN